VSLTTSSALARFHQAPVIKKPKHWLQGTLRNIFGSHRAWGTVKAGPPCVKECQRLDLGRSECTTVSNVTFVGCEVENEKLKPPKKNDDAQNNSDDKNKFSNYKQTPKR
jgi:hypothetical protein